MLRWIITAAGVLALAADTPRVASLEWAPHVIAEGFANQTVAADFTGDGRLEVITGDITATTFAIGRRLRIVAESPEPRRG